MLFCCISVDKALVASVALISKPVTKSRHVLVRSFLACESLVTGIAGMIFVIPVVQGVHVLSDCVPGIEFTDACLTLVTHLDIGQ
jgi:hypothetical protein